jgi:hypothetical protein
MLYLLRVNPLAVCCPCSRGINAHNSQQWFAASVNKDGVLTGQ